MPRLGAQRAVAAGLVGRCPWGSGTMASMVSRSNTPMRPTLPGPLLSAIERAGYYPALVADVVAEALSDAPVLSHLVHQETTFDHDTIRRHVTVLVLTDARLIIVHADDHTDDPHGRGGSSRPRRAKRSRCGFVRGIMLTHVVPNPRNYVPGSLGPRGHPDARLGDGQPGRPGAGHLRRPLRAMADHGFEGSIASDDLVLRISADADGPDRSPRPRTSPPRSRPRSACDLGGRRPGRAPAPSAELSAYEPPAGVARDRRVLRGIRSGPGEPAISPCLRPSSAVVVLLDGLGLELLKRRAGHAPYLRSLLPSATELTCGFPSTTATSLASLGTGLAPGVHGLLGYELRRSPTPAPSSTTCRGRAGRIRWCGSRTRPPSRSWLAAGWRWSGSDWRASTAPGLTVAAQRGGRFRGAGSLSAGVREAVRAVRAMKRGVVYLYWGDIDRAGHMSGLSSPQWVARLEEADAACARSRSRCHGIRP
jgi:hypothetical protein